jgi:hypothetical protein
MHSTGMRSPRAAIRPALAGRRHTRSFAIVIAPPDAPSAVLGHRIRGGEILPVKTQTRLGSSRRIETRVRDLGCRFERTRLVHP